MQCLIQLITTNEEIFILNQLINDEQLILTLSLHPHGSHVIQKIIQFLPEARRETVNNVILSNFLPLSLNMYGICTLKFFMNANVCLKLRRAFITILTGNIIQISTNNFGNYVLQFAVNVQF
jgi:hypothetical protein